MQSRGKLIWGIVGLLLGGAAAVAGMTLFNRTQPAPILISPPEPTTLPPPTGTPEPIHVFIHGAVKSPDVYLIPAGSIVEQAIESAGGFTAEADIDALNQALPLGDGAEIYVPTLAETAAGDSRGPAYQGVTQQSQSAAPGSSGSGSTLININTAGLEQLDTLPGIGPATAQKIVTHREERGPFQTIEAIMDVSGIGPAKFSQIESLITVQGE